MFQDEARFGRINEPKRCWARSGVRPIVGAQIVREYTYAFGAVCPFDGRSVFLILPSMNSSNMSLFLSEVGARHSEEDVLMFMDGASCHKSRALCVPSNIRIRIIPPYSPELNPTENIWDEMREKFFKNTVFNSMNAVEEQLTEACSYFEETPTKVHSITGFSWIVSN
jgi:transposase